MTELWNNWYETLVSIEALATVIVIAVVASGASFTSLKELQEHIDAYINAYHDKAEPFVWTKKKVRQRRFKGRRITQL